jgi:pullulanase/glycogen debranching enzyme
MVRVTNLTPPGSGGNPRRTYVTNQVTPGSGSASPYSAADVINGGDGAQLASDGPEYRPRALRQFPAQEVVYELSVADFTSHVSAGNADTPGWGCTS